MRRLLVRATIALALLAPGTAAVAAAAPPAPGASSGTAQGMARGGSDPAVVDVSTFPPPSGGAEAEHAVKPQRTQGQGLDIASLRSRKIAQAQVPAAADQASIQVATTNTLIGTSFDGEAALGGVVGTEPPDTQAAVSSSYIAEFVNRSGAIYDRATLSRTQFFDLANLFPTPAGYFVGDPRILYDPANDKFVASGMAYNQATNNSIIYVLVSQTNAPTNWFRYTVPAPQKASGVAVDATFSRSRERTIAGQRLSCVAA
jgi:hypothetical protein